MTTIQNIQDQIIQTAESLLKQQGSVAPLEVLVRIGFLHPVHVEEWETGNIPYLEFLFEKESHKIRYIIRWFQTWALQKGLKSQETTYLTKSSTLSLKQLDFTKKGRPQTELLYRTHFRVPESSKQIKPISSHTAPPPKKPVILPHPNHGQCAQCQKSLIRGSLYCLIETRSYCLSCGDAMISPFAKFEKNYK